MYNPQRGASLVELLIAMLIGSILLMVLSTLVASTHRSGIRTIELNSDANALLRFKLALTQLESSSNGPCPSQSLDANRLTDTALTMRHFLDSTYGANITGTALAPDSFDKADAGQPIDLWLFADDCSVSIPLSYRYSLDFDHESFIKTLDQQQLSDISLSLPATLLASLANTSNLRVAVVTETRFENRTVDGCHHLYLKQSHQHASSWLSNFSINPSSLGLELRGGCKGERSYQLATL